MSKMFSKFTSILQHAVNSECMLYICEIRQVLDPEPVGKLSPQLTLQEEFVYHWKAITTYFIDNKGDQCPVEHTNIPGHLEQMLVLLQTEESQGEKGMYGLCLEYLLQHKLLDTLYSIGKTDYPPGMKQTVLSFFTKLLSWIRQPILAHVSVYKAVQRMVKTCGEVKAAPTEIEEIQFLCTVCAKVKSDPYLVNFFLEKPQPKQSNSVAGAKSPIIDNPYMENKLEQDFHLVSTLLSLSHSEDSRVAVKACEGLILCSSLPDPVAAHCMINNTKFCADLTQRLVDTYKRLPDSINPLDLENVQAKWGMEIVTLREDEQTFVGKRHLVSFLSWLDYCDQLSAIANPIVAEALARHIHEAFLVPYFLLDLQQISETRCISTTAYMTRCLRTVCSERLLSEFVLFLLGDAKYPEKLLTSKDCLRTRLIDRCNSVSDDVCVVTLQLFDTLLQKDDEQILHNLVLLYLENREYYDKTKGAVTFDEQVDDDSVIVHDKTNSCTSMKGDCVKYCEENTNQTNEASVGLKDIDKNCLQSQSSIKTDESICANYSISEILTGLSMSEEVIANNKAVHEDVVVSQCNNGAPCNFNKIRLNELETNLSPFSTPVHVKTEVHKIVTSLLTLLPDELKSSYQTADGGYDMYLKDAHRQYTSMIECCKCWVHPCNNTSSKSSDSAIFYEGSFLRMLLDKMSHLLDQSYHVNLQLTSVISKLALVPLNCLNEYLLDPYLPLKPGVRTLYSVLQKVSNEIRSQSSTDLELGRKLIHIRHKLMGNSTHMHSIRQYVDDNCTRCDDDSRLEAIIVFEEFCKELAAIAFVKHHAAVTGEMS